MFPNVRLMIVSILAAIAGIGCGLGLFATFRVNHEPLSRLAEGSPPLQLALDNRSLGTDTRVPLEVRSPVNDAAKLVPVPVIIDIPSPAPSATLSAAPSPAPSNAPEQSGADAAIAGDSSVQRAAIDSAAEDRSNPASLAVAVPVEQSNVTPEPGAPSQQEVVAAVPDQQPADAAATAPATEHTAALNAAAEVQQPAAKPAKSGTSKATKPAARATRAAPARRAAKTVRARRTLARVAAQQTYQYPQANYSQPTYSQPTYTWADGTARAAQPVKRVQIKRHRTAKKVTPTAQSNPPAVTAGLSSTQ